MAAPGSRGRPRPTVPRRAPWSCTSWTRRLRQRRLLAGRPGAWDEKPAWAPDGRTIAFWSNRDGSPHVHLVDAAGTGLRRLTAGNARFDGMPAFAPAAQAACRKFCP